MLPVLPVVVSVVSVVSVVLCGVLSASLGFSRGDPSGRAATGQKRAETGQRSPKIPIYIGISPNLLGVPRSAQEFPGVPAKTPFRQKSKFHHGQHALKGLQRSDNSKF